MITNLNAITVVAIKRLRYISRGNLTNAVIEARQAILNSTVSFIAETNETQEITDDIGITPKEI